jgi:3-hydroxyacyl-[acyl-carrier-protein] dehydratase
MARFALTTVVILACGHTAAAFAPIARPPALLRRTRAVVSAEAEAAEAEGATATRSAADISALTSDVTTIFSSEDIAKILPHRYPFALVDKVVEYEAGKRAVGIKSVTLNEPQFTGHFPDRPIMPGVMQIEALAQLSGIICLQMEGAAPGAIFFFAGVDGVKWKKPVVPGDTLVMEVRRRSPPPDPTPPRLLLRARRDGGPSERASRSVGAHD